MPTALERAGDFSQTLNSSGQLRFIRDPLSGQACNVNTGGPGCFPGNRIPANRISPIGQQMLGLFPLPNATDPSGSRQYNYTYQNELEKPRNDQVARVDLNINRDTTFYTRVQFGNEVNSRGYNAFLGAGTGNGGNAAWPQFNTSYEVGSLSLVSTLLHTLNSSTVMEVTYRPQLGRAARQPRRSGIARRQRPPRRPRRADAVLPEREPAVPGAADQLRRHQRAAEHPGRRRRRPLSLQRQEHHPQLLGEHLEDCRPPQPEGGRVLRAHGAAGAARRRLQRQLQLRRQHQQPVRHQPRVRQRAARIDQQLHRVDREAVCRGPVQPGRDVRAGQLARDVASDARFRRALLLHRADLRGRAGRVGTSIPTSGAPATRRSSSSRCARTTPPPAPAASARRGTR